MKCTAFETGDTIRSARALRLYRFTDPKWGDVELWDVFRNTCHTGDKIPQGILVRVGETVHNIYTELEVIESSHPGIASGQRVVAIVVSPHDWQRAEISA